MALLTKVRSIQHFNFKILYTTYNSGLLGSFLCHQSIAVDLDAMDSFTTRLMQRKAEKWESLKIKKSLPIEAECSSKTETTIENVAYLNANEINSLLKEALDENDKDKLSTIVSECVRHKKCPSLSVITNTLSFFSQNGDIDGVKSMRLISEDAYHDFVSSNSYFNHYLAEAIWVRGNVSKAVDLFSEVYKTNVYLRRRIRLLLRYLIYDAVVNRSEAVLFCIVKFTEGLVKDYKDYYPLMCLWQVCFLSEWYTDQCLALEILKRNEGFCKSVTSQLSHVVSASLKYHRTEPVYRLLEIFLKYDLKMQSSTVLVALFEYRFRQSDLQSCIEIYNWSAKHNIVLPTIQNERFLKLLLRRDNIVPSKKPKSPAPSYQLKF